MESSFESKTGTIHRSDSQIFEFLSDFTHFSALIPEGKVSGWQATADHCSFEVNNIGKIAFRIVEKEPDKTIKAAIETAFAEDVFLWIQLKPAAPYETNVQLTLKADMSPMIKMMVAGKVTGFLDKLVDALARI